MDYKSLQDAYSALAKLNVAIARYPKNDAFKQDTIAQANKLKQKIKRLEAELNDPKPKFSQHSSLSYDPLKAFDNLEEESREFEAIDETSLVEEKTLEQLRSELIEETHVPSPPKVTYEEVLKAIPTFTSTEIKEIIKKCMDNL